METLGLREMSWEVWEEFSVEKCSRQIESQGRFGKSSQ